MRAPVRWVGVLCAMASEAAPLLAALGAGEPQTAAGVTVYPLAGGHLLALGGVGKVNAALAAGLLIGSFGATEVLNAGCAGALADLPVGTLVVARSCVQHDVDTSLAGDPPGFVSTVDRVDFPCHRPQETAALLAARGIPATLGVVATGDWFGRDMARARAVRDRFGALLCDMEAGAAAQVCLRWGVPFRALKGVSDHLFAPRQDLEYAQNLSAALAPLPGAVAALLEE